MKSSMVLITAILIQICTACQPEEKENTPRVRNQKGEYIQRRSDETVANLDLPKKIPPPLYPWDKFSEGDHHPITKEFFRCKGSTLNPAHIVQKQDGPVHYYDCGGVDTHSLPLRDGKEFVYPILIDLLNFIQTKTGKKVVITCGHRCPEHNTYADESVENQCSKHTIGAEVAFYVQGMEHDPETIVKYIQEYYQETPIYKELKDSKDYLTFQRYEKPDTNVTTTPWYNKEIFVKLYKKHEGRNFDNRHSHAYISIQVRFDRDLNERVNYSWDKAHRNYHRW